MVEIKALIGQVATGAALSREAAFDAFESMMSGDVTPSQIGGLLMALRVRGETVEEITGAVTAMRAQDALPSRRPPTPSTWSAPAATPRAPTTSPPAPPSSSPAPECRWQSTATARCRRARARRTCSWRSASRSISAPETISTCIREAGIGFMFAPAHHPAMKHVGPTRVELGTRTIFNLLGPLSNPAGVKRQMVGVFSRQWVEPLAQVLKNLGSERAYVVHGSDGLDEITTAGTTAVAALENGAVRCFEIAPEDVGLPRVKPEALRGGDAEANAEALKAVLEGIKGPYRDVAVLNAAAALVVAAKAKDLAHGVALAQHAIDSGEAEGSLDRLIAVSNA